jgi:hypothetical protein
VLAIPLCPPPFPGQKKKHDRVDSEKITHLLRTNLIPPGYVYPAAKRPLRALLRQRLLYVWNRSELLSRIQSHQLAYNPAHHPPDSLQPGALGETSPRQRTRSRPPTRLAK